MGVKSEIVGIQLDYHGYLCCLYVHVLWDNPLKQIHLETVLVRQPPIKVVRLREWLTIIAGGWGVEILCEGINFHGPS